MKAPDQNGPIRIANEILKVRLNCLTLIDIPTFAFEVVVTTLTITAKGQVSLRKDILRHLGAGPGDKIIVETLAGGRVEVRAARAKGKISDAFGYLKRQDGTSLSIDEINEIIADGWAGRR